MQIFVSATPVLINGIWALAWDADTRVVIVDNQGYPVWANQHVNFTPAQSTTGGIQEALNYLPANRTAKAKVTVIGSITTTSIITIPSYTTLDLTNAQITYTGSAKIPGGNGTYGAVFINKNWNANAIDQDSFIEIIGGIITPNVSTQGMAFGGVKNLIITQPYIILTSGGQAGIVLDGANHDVKINKPSVIGYTANTDHFCHGIYLGGSPNTNTYKNNYDIVCDSPFIFGISGDPLVFNGCHRVTMMNPVMYCVGNTANSNKNDIFIDMEQNASSAEITQDILIEHPVFRIQAGTVNYICWIGANSGSEVDHVIFRDIDVDLAGQNPSSVFAWAGINKDVVFEGGRIYNAVGNMFTFYVPAGGTLGTKSGCAVKHTIFDTVGKAFAFSTGGISIDLDIEGCIFVNHIAAGSPIFNNAASPVTGKITVRNCRYDGSGSGNFIVPIVTTIASVTAAWGNLRMVDLNEGYQPQGLAITTPAVPASTVDIQNQFPFAVRIIILTIGTITSYQITDSLGNIQSVTTTLSAGQVIELAQGAKIQFTYTGAPTWKWYGV